jgi:carbon-monoxide dehydrogenase small subunit
MYDPDALLPVQVSVNGTSRAAATSARTLLSDFLRHELMLTGTHVGCEQGACGACTVIVNGEAVRSCLMLAVQANGAEITTVEGLGSEGELSPLQEQFWRCHGLQCGFCTPGVLCSVTAMGAEPGPPSDDEIADVLGGHACRCTGYQNIRRAVAAYLAHENPAPEAAR